MPALKQKKTDSASIDAIIKLVPIISLFIGVVSGLYSAVTYLYQQNKTIEETQYKNFREIVANLASEKKAERLASVINLGTFVSPDGMFVSHANPYQDQAIDALINMLLTELDTDILQVINNILKRIEPGQHKEILGKLLTIERSIFIYKDAIKYRFQDIQNLNGSWSINHQNSETEFLASFDKRLEALQRDYQPALENKKSTPNAPEHNAGKEHSPDAGKFLIQSMVDRYKKNLEQEKEFEDFISKNQYRKELIGNFIIEFLSIYRKQPLEGLELYQNSLNFAVISDLNLPKIDIKLSAITSATIQGCDFNHASVQNTTFANSVIRDTNFSFADIKASLFTNVASLKGADFTHAKFKDVFFVLTDVSGANFTGAEGLEPIHFFQAKNLDKAIFDPKFRQAWEDQQMSSISEQAFKEKINDSTLSGQRIDELVKALER